jgi:nicotinamide riboside transporter PnuC
MSCGQLCVTVTLVTFDAAGFQISLINAAVQLIIVFNPEFYPSILLDIWIRFPAGASVILFGVLAGCGAQSASPGHWAPDFISSGL